MPLTRDVMVRFVVDQQDEPVVELVRAEVVKFSIDEGDQTDPLWQTPQNVARYGSPANHPFASGDRPFAGPAELGGPAGPSPLDDDEHCLGIEFGIGKPLALIWTLNRSNMSGLPKRARVRQSSSQIAPHRVTAHKEDYHMS